MSARDFYSRHAFALTFGIEDIQAQEVLPALATSWCLDTQPMS
jgi:hypothetical protein